MRRLLRRGMPAAVLVLALGACGGGNDNEGGAEEFGADEEIGAPNPQVQGGGDASVPMAAPGVQTDSMTNPDRPGPGIQAPLGGN